MGYKFLHLSFKLDFSLAIPAEHSAYIQSPLFDQNGWSIWHGTSHLLPVVRSFVRSFSGFVSPWDCRGPYLWRISTTLLNLRHAGSIWHYGTVRVVVAIAEKKKKKKNERGKWKRSGVVSGFIRLLRNESSENGRVRVDHKKRITTASRRCRYTYRCGVVAAARRASEKPDYHRYSPRNEISCWETFWIDRTIGSWRSAYKYLEYWRTYFDFILRTFLRAVDRASFRLGESKHTALLSVNEIFCESVYSK